MRKLNPHVVALIVLGLVIAAVLVFIIVRGGNSGQDKLGDEIGSNIAAEDPEARCAATSNNDRIKRELFRRAAATRATDQAAYEKLAGYAVIRSETPILRGYDQR
ncbi:MAG TPA: hypothetical protein VFZ35_01355, partial [Sphingomicrobium sp.]